MMSDDLDWTQELGDALAYQQKDVLVAIQQLRDEAVAKGIIKTDDKIEVVEGRRQCRHQVGQPGSHLRAAIRARDALCAGLRAWRRSATIRTLIPITTTRPRTFFAGVVTGAIWGAAVDWNHWGVWGGRWNGGGVDIDCNNCFNNRDFNGKININDVDWKNVDRSKIKIDKNQFNKIDRKNISKNIRADGNKSIGDKAANLKKGNASTLPGKAAGTRDVRKSTLDGLKNKPGNTAMAKPDLKKPANKPNVSKPASKPNVSKPANVSRPSGKPKPGGKIDKRPSKPTGLGNVSPGKHKRSRQSGAQRAWAAAIAAVAAATSRSSAAAAASVETGQEEQDHEQNILSVARWPDFWRCLADACLWR